MGANFWVSMEENFEQTAQTEMFEDTSAYKVRLDNFEGPLDLLLHLIKEAKLDIATVKLSAITEQYLEYMEDRKSTRLNSSHITRSRMPSSA